MDQAITRASGSTPSTTPPAAAAARLVGEFQGYVDGQPSVVWADRKNMPKVGDRLFAIPAHAAAQRSWSILLTSANHGTVGPLGSTFPHAGEHHERVVVVEMPTAAGAPSDEVNLVLRAAPAAKAGGDAGAALSNERIEELWDETPTADAETFREVRYRFARAIEREVAAQAGQVAATDDHLTEDQKWLLESAEMVRSGGYPELASKIRANCKASVAGQVAVPEMTDAEIVSVWQGMPGGAEGWLKQFGYLQFARAVLAAAPAAPAQAKPLPAGWISVDERLPEGRYCLATYQDRAGKLRIIRAMYVRQFEIEASGDECDSETNEENDLEYLKAGWYEMIDNWGEYSSVHVSEGPVTHWTPLPALPDVQASTAGGRQEGGAA